MAFYVDIYLRPYFAINIIKYGTSHHTHSAACTILDGFYFYLAKMIRSLREYVNMLKVNVVRIFVGSVQGILVDHRSTISSFHSGQLLWFGYAKM